MKIGEEIEDGEHRQLEVVVEEKICRGWRSGRRNSSGGG